MLNKPPLLIRCPLALIHQLSIQVIDYNNHLQVFSCLYYHIKAYWAVIRQFTTLSNDFQHHHYHRRYQLVPVAHRNINID